MEYMIEAFERVSFLFYTVFFTPVIKDEDSCPRTITNNFIRFIIYITNGGSIRYAKTSKKE